MSAFSHTFETDSPRDRIGAAAFVLSLRARGVFDLPLLRAMETVPREVFAPRRYLDLARSDVALPLACGETMTAPAAVASMLAALDARPGQRVLEVGTGSGYVAALLARMGAVLHSIERHATLADSARSRLAAAGVVGVELACGCGLEGGSFEGRYDRIVLNGAVDYVAPALMARLASGGRLVGAHVGSGGVARLLVLDRGEDGQLAHRLGGTLRITRLVAPAVKADSGSGNGSLT